VRDLAEPRVRVERRDRRERAPALGRLGDDEVVVAKLAICGRCVTQRICQRRASSRSFSPITAPRRPPTFAVDLVEDERRDGAVAGGAAPWALA